MRLAGSKAGVLFLVLVPVLVSAVHGSGSGSQVSVTLTDPQIIAEGAKLFATSCGNAYCHGTGGNGGGAPRLRGKGLEAAYAFKTISTGLPGTSMPGFKSELSEEQVWKVVAFILSDAKVGAASPADGVKAAPSSALPVKPAGAVTGSLVGNAQAGRALFFDSSQPRSCYACHSFNGEGTQIGPDLSAAVSRSPRDLFLSIILMREPMDPKYATIAVLLRNGEKILGVKKEEDAESLRVYDTTALPAVLRTVQRTDVANIEYPDESVMPKDYSSAYTLKQLLDLVTFLKSSESKSPVTLRDLLE
jgi:putative heme-binding domain-containing protein